MVLEYLKKKLSGVADDFVLLKTSADSNSIKFVNNLIVKNSIDSITDISIFAVKDKKIVSTSLKELNEKSVNKSIKNIVEFFKFTKPNENYLGIAKGPFNYKKVNNLYDKKIKDLNCVDVVESGINSALKNSKRASGVFDTVLGKRRIITSENIDVSEDFSSLYFSIRALNTDDASGHKTCSSRILNGFNVEKISEKAGEISKRSLNPEKGRAGVFDMVIDPLPAAGLIEFVGDALSVYNVEAGMSFFANKLKQRIGKFNLIDQGNLDGGMSSSIFDSEGVPTQKTKIIDEGVLNSYLHNTSTAKKYGIKTTANAGLISPEPTNLILNGKIGNPFDIKKGIYVTNLWYTRFQNYASGDFSTIPRDGMFLIENGEVTKPIKNLRISENILNLLKNIEIFGKEKEQITSWENNTPVITSNLLIKNIKFSKPLG
jgi:PmbA protein